MANDLSTRPIKVDTVMGAAAALGRPLKVKKVLWHNPTLSGDTFVITEPTSGKVLLEGRAEAANGSQNFDFDRGTIWRDFQVGTLASGTLYIFAT